MCTCASGAFADDDVIHVDGDVNPVRDMGVIFEELRLKDRAYIEGQIDGLNKKRVTDKKVKPEYVSVIRIRSNLTLSSW